MSRAYFERGARVEEASGAVTLGEYADWVEPESVLVNVRRLYQEIQVGLPIARAMSFRRQTSLRKMAGPGGNGAYQGTDS